MLRTALSANLGFDRSLFAAASALAAGDRAEQALLDARAVDARVRGLQVGQEPARTAPARRSLRGQLGLYAQASTQVDLAVRNTRVLARAVLAVTRRGAPAPDALAAAR